jgi:hypothetical protein
MGKLKEKMLNNNSEEDNQFELSAFEYVELVERYKDRPEEPLLTDDELANFEQMVQDYYNSKEFREYVENYTPTDDYANSLTDAEIDAAFVEHNLDEDELEVFNQSITLKYTDNDILDVLDGMVDPQKMNIILGRLNNVWNTKNGLDI